MTEKEDFSRLYNEYFSPIYRYIYFRVGSKMDAEDIVQEVFLKAFSSAERYNDFARMPVSFFYIIARNAVIDHFRRKKIIVNDEEVLLSVPDNGSSPEENAATAEEVLKLRQKISELPEMEKEAVILKFMNGMETKEICLILGKSEEAVRQLQSRGLKTLRKLFNEHE